MNRVTDLFDLFITVLFSLKLEYQKTTYATKSNLKMDRAVTVNSKMILLNVITESGFAIL